MTFKSSFCSTRRGFLLGGATVIGAVATGGLPLWSAIARAGETPAPDIVDMLLRPGAARASLVSNPAIQTDVWAYNGMVPGPEIRIRQGSVCAPGWKIPCRRKRPFTGTGFVFPMPWMVCPV